MATKMKPVEPATNHQATQVAQAAQEGRDEVFAQANTPENAMDRAAAFIRAKVREAWKTEMTMAIDVGHYIVEDYYDGDREALRSQSPTKGASLRDLADRLDGVMNYQALWRCVQVYLHVEVFPEAVRNALAPTTFVKLLKAPEKDRQALAEKTVDNQWTAAKVAEEVRTLKGSTPRAKKGAAADAPVSATVETVAETERDAEVAVPTPSSEENVTVPATVAQVEPSGPPVGRNMAATMPSEVTLDDELQYLDNFVAVMGFWTVQDDRGTRSPNDAGLFAHVRPDVEARMWSDPEFAERVREIIRTFGRLHRPFAAVLKEIGMPL